MSLNAYADVTFSFSLRGDGRDDSYVFRPVSPQSFVAWAPPGALSTGSPMYRTRAQYLAGTVGLVDLFKLQGLLPWAPNYVAVVPPTNSSNRKWLLGSPTDSGIELVQYLPAFIAIPNPVPSGWAVYYFLTSNEDLDLYLF